MIQNKYAAIITSDGDFKRISRNYRRQMISKYGSLENCPEHVPAVIFISRKDTWHSTRDLLEKNAEEIRQYIEKNDAVCARVSNEGVVPTDLVIDIAPPSQDGGPLAPGL